MVIKCLIVEDNLMAAKTLEQLCQKIKNLEVVGLCADIQQAKEILQNERIDLIFLDIEMGDESGFSLLDNCVENQKVIVVSSKEDYAYEAFQYEVDHYLKKPTTLPKLRLAVERIKADIQETKVEKDDHQNLFIKSDGRLTNIKIEDILFVENVGDYVRFQLSDESHVVYVTLKKLMTRLPSKSFMKVHRSFIVNLDKIRDLEDNSLLVGKKIIPVSRANKMELLKKLNLL